MKIDGTKSSSEVNKKKETKKSSGDGSFKGMVNGGSSGSVSGSGLSAGISSLDILLAAQAVGDSTQGSAKKQAKLRAVSILDRLDQLRLAIMGGNVTIGHMISIADVVAVHRENITDPDLTAILDEIDLRAQVELAKLNKARSPV